MTQGSPADAEVILAPPHVHLDVIAVTGVGSRAPAQCLHSVCQPPVNRLLKDSGKPVWHYSKYLKL
jgi:hypothetical protein